MRSSAFVAVFLSLSACGSGEPAAGDAESRTLPESAFASLQERGGVTMGVDQYASTHLFDDLPNGARIELQVDEPDEVGTRQIREHLQHIAGAFKAGDFSDPTFVHAGEMPGTAVMAAKKDVISYEFAELPRGGEVRITTEDPEALAAIHAFMAAQRGDHRAGGHVGH